MDMDEEDGGDQSFSQLSCGPNCMAPKLLVGVVKAEQDAQNTTLYVIQVTLLNTELEWTVKRRYSDFLKVREDVHYNFLGMNVNQCFGCRWFSQSLRDFDFPRKHVISSKDRTVIRHRKSQLDRFARLMAAHTFSAIPKCVNCSKMPFFRIRDFFTKNALLPAHVSAKQIRKALVPEKFAAISDPSKSKIEFRRGNGIFKVLQVEKPIYVQWSEYDQATRTKRLQRRCSSCTSCATAPVSTSTQLDTSVDFEEDKLPVAHVDDQEDEDELDFTGVHTDDIIPSTVTLQPLRKKKQDNNTITERPRADARADTVQWERWELNSPKRTAAKEA